MIVEGASPSYSATDQASNGSDEWAFLCSASHVCFATNDQDPLRPAIPRPGDPPFDSCGVSQLLDCCSLMKGEQIPFSVYLSYTEGRCESRGAPNSVVCVASPP
jgi:hypothetical protein